MLTRNFLSGMGLTADQVSAIIEAHAETVEALKGQRDEYKTKAEQFDEVNSKMAGMSQELEELKANGGDWQTKYEKEHSDFEAYKNAQTEKETKVAKETAYRKLLIDNGVSEKRLDAILKVTNLEEIELTSKGELKSSEKLAESIKNEWADFITSTDTIGANTQVPPITNGNGAFDQMSLSEKMSYANEHPNDASVMAWLNN